MRAAPLVACALMTLPLLAQEAAMQRGPLRLSLKRAIEIAVSPEGSARIELAEEAVQQAKGRSGQARAALLPDFEATAGMQDLTRSLVTQGFTALRLPFGYVIPERVGPFSVMDARASVTQSVLDLSAIQRYRAASTLVNAAKTDVESQNDLVAAEVARAYLGALRAEAELDAAQANINMSEAVWGQAQRQKDAGTGTAIDITRSRVVLSNDKQRLLVAQNHRRKAILQLLRAMRMRLDSQVELTDRLGYSPIDPMTMEQAKDVALKTRPDLRTQDQRVAAAKLNYSAAKFERMPTLVTAFDYGAIGWLDTKVLPTRTFTVGMRVPIFDGGRRDAHRAETAAQFRQERIRADELREQIELELRVALDSLASAEEQVKVAEEGLALAESELTQARRRYEAGVAVGIEVTDAQTRVARARDNQIAALFGYNLSRVDLGQALGDTRRLIPIKE